MKRVLATILLLALSAAASQARQQEQPTPGSARLIDEFGEIQISDLKARLDNFAVELQNNPGSTGLITAYGATHKFPGWPMRRIRLMQNYLINTRGLDASLFTLVNAGLRDDTYFELWLVPPGAALPKPTPLAASHSLRRRHSGSAGILPAKACLSTLSRQSISLDGV